MNEIETFTTNPKLLDMIKEAHKESPDIEVCGVLKGKFHKGIVSATESVQIENISDRMKEVDYVMNPQQFMNSISDTSFINKKSEKDFVCIWHTHPHGIPFPSEIDRQRAEHNVVYLIYGGGQGEFRAWKLIKTKAEKYFREITINNMKSLHEYGVV